MKITLLLCLLSIVSFGQTTTKTKRITVGETNGLSITGSVSFDEANTPQDTTYYFMGRDVRYRSIVEIILLQRGEIETIKALLEKCLEAFNEDDGTMLTYGESTISVNKIMGVKSVSLYGIGDDSNGYIYLSKNWINKLLTKIEEHLQTRKG